MEAVAMEQFIELVGEEYKKRDPLLLDRAGYEDFVARTVEIAQQNRDTRDTQKLLRYLREIGFESVEYDEEESSFWLLDSGHITMLRLPMTPETLSAVYTLIQEDELETKEDIYSKTKDTIKEINDNPKFVVSLEDGRGDLLKQLLKLQISDGIIIRVGEGRVSFSYETGSDRLEYSYEEPAAELEENECRVGLSTTYLNMLYKYCTPTEIRLKGTDQPALIGMDFTPTKGTLAFSMQALLAPRVPAH